MSGVRVPQSVQTKKIMNNFIQYVKGSFEELSTNMTWSTKEEAQKSTLIVAIFTIIFALLVAGMDKVFQRLLDVFFNLFS